MIHPTRCFVCNTVFLEEVTDVVYCCRRTFHRSCIKDAKRCPYCSELWLSLCCCVCKKYCTSAQECVQIIRMSCCSADYQSRCFKSIYGHCPGCHVERDHFQKPLGMHDWMGFVQLRRETRRNQRRRRALCKK